MVGVVEDNDPEVQCPACAKIYVPDLAKEPDWESKLLLWKGGQLIQRVWPDANPYQREQLQTGVCSDECWDKFVGREG